jgi:hypothetical protein
VAEGLEDKAAEIAIAKAIDDVQNRINKGILLLYSLSYSFATRIYCITLFDLSIKRAG